MKNTLIALSLSVCLTPLAQAAPVKAPAGPEPTELEARVISGEFQKKGFYRADKKGFVDAGLQTLLNHYAAGEGVKVSDLVETSGAHASGGGDLEQGLLAGQPKWLGVFQKSVASSTKWGTRQAVQSRLLGAFYYRFLRKLYAKHNEAHPEAKLAMPVSVEYFLQHLGKSLSRTQQKSANGNGMADFKTIGGGGPNYCAAASGQALKHGLAAYGYKMGPIGYAREHGFKMLKAMTPSSAKGYQLQPGDVCSIRSATGPKTGHVLTVAYPVQMDSLNTGTMWVTSGNAMLNSVATDFVTVERVKGERPSPGKIMILNCTSNGDIAAAHAAGEALAKFKVTPLKGAEQSKPGYPTATSERLTVK